MLSIVSDPVRLVATTETCKFPVEVLLSDFSTYAVQSPSQPGWMVGDGVSVAVFVGVFDGELDGFLVDVRVGVAWFGWVAALVWVITEVCPWVLVIIIVGWSEGRGAVAGGDSCVIPGVLVMV